MTTIVNNPGPERVVETEGGSGWAVAVVILLAIIAIGAYYWMSQRGTEPTPNESETGDTNINVTLPTPGASSETSNTTP